MHACQKNLESLFLAKNGKKLSCGAHEKDGVALFACTLKALLVCVGAPLEVGSSIFSIFKSMD